MDEAGQNLKEVFKRRDHWLRRHKVWEWFSIVLSVTIAGLSAFVASSVSKEWGRDYAAVIVAVCAGLQATLRPAQRSREFREAWIDLDHAVREEENTSPRLLDAIRRGENRIGGTHAERPLTNLPTNSGTSN